MRLAIALLLAAGVALVGIALPSDTWWLIVLRVALIGGALMVGLRRLWMLNALEQMTTHGEPTESIPDGSEG